ncbi:MAG: hypothetical protein V3R49_00435 [Gammaproteobacteria bacterium]
MGFIGDLLGSNVSKQAEESARKIEETTREGMDISGERFGEVTERLDPYLMGGQSAYEQMLAQMGLGGEAIDPTQTAGFRKPFDFAQGKIEERLAGTGMLYSGELGTALHEQAGAQYYDKYLPMLMGMGQMGQQGAFQYGGMGMDEATRRANMLMGGTETAEGLKVQGQAAKSAALGGLVGSIGGAVGTVAGAGGFNGMFGGGGGGGTPTPTTPLTAGQRLGYFG